MVLASKQRPLACAAASEGVPALPRASVKRLAMAWGLRAPRAPTLKVPRVSHFECLCRREFPGSPVSNADDTSLHVLPSSSPRSPGAGPIEVELAPIRAPTPDLTVERSPIFLPEGCTYNSMTRQLVLLVARNGRAEQLLDLDPLAVLGLPLGAHLRAVAITQLTARAVKSDLRLDDSERHQAFLVTLVLLLDSPIPIIVMAHLVPASVGDAFLSLYSLLCKDFPLDSHGSTGKSRNLRVDSVKPAYGLLWLRECKTNTSNIMRLRLQDCVLLELGHVYAAPVQCECGVVDFVPDPCQVVIHRADGASVAQDASPGLRFQCRPCFQCGGIFFATRAVVP